jgi:hypothetical protein
LSSGLHPPVGAWGWALRVVGWAPHQLDDHHLRLWSRGARGDSEEKGPDGGHGTLLPQALRSVATPGSGVPPPASTCWPNTSGICRVFITLHGFWVRSGVVNLALAGNCHFAITADHLRWDNLLGKGRYRRSRHCDDEDDLGTAASLGARTVGAGSRCRPLSPWRPDRCPWRNRAGGGSLWHSGLLRAYTSTAVPELRP